MESIKCQQCGLVTWADSETVSCKRCGGPLWQKNDYGAGFAVNESPGESIFSGVIKFLTIFFGVAVLALLASKSLHLGGTDAAKIIGIPIAILGALASIGMSLWFFARVFGESVGWGLAAIFLPFGALVALIKFWDRTHRPFIAHAICVGIIFAGIFTCT